MCNMTWYLQSFFHGLTRALKVNYPENTGIWNGCLQQPLKKNFFWSHELCMDITDSTHIDYLKDFALDYLNTLALASELQNKWNHWCFAQHGMFWLSIIEAWSWFPRRKLNNLDSQTEQMQCKWPCGPNIGHIWNYKWTLSWEQKQSQSIAIRTHMLYLHLCERICFHTHNQNKIIAPNHMSTKSKNASLNGWCWCNTNGKISLHDLCVPVGSSAQDKKDFCSVIVDEEWVRASLTSDLCVPHPSPAQAKEQHILLVIK